MNYQVKLKFKEKYENNPVAFVEDFYNIKLFPWQKALLKMMNFKERLTTYFSPHRSGKKMLLKGQLEYMKSMKMDFQVWTKEGIEVYEKGILVKTLKYKTE